MACAMAPPASAPSGRTPWKSRRMEELTRPRRRSGVIACRKLRSLMLLNRLVLARFSSSQNFATKPNSPPFTA
jgi:hypothetical protein